MTDFLTRPDTRTPRWSQSPAEYGSAITKFAPVDRRRHTFADYAVAVGFGLMVGLLLGWGF